MPLTLALVSMNLPLKSMAMSPVPPKETLLGRPFSGLPLESLRRMLPTFVSAPLANLKRPICGVKFGIGKASTFAKAIVTPAAWATGAARVTFKVMVVAVALAKVAVIVSDWTVIEKVPKVELVGSDALKATVIWFSTVPIAALSVVVGDAATFGPRSVIV